MRDLMECKLSYMIGPHAPAAPSNVRDAPRFFAGPRLATYGPGFYEELEFDGRSFNLLVRKTETGDNAYLLYDISFVERRERERERALAWAGLAALLGVAVFSFFAARGELFAQIGRFDPEQRGARLQLAGDDSELLVIVDAFNRYLLPLDALVVRPRAAAHGTAGTVGVVAGAGRALSGRAAAGLRRVGARKPGRTYLAARCAGRDLHQSAAQRPAGGRGGSRCACVPTA